VSNSGYYISTFVKCVFMINMDSNIVDTTSKLHLQNYYYYVIHSQKNPITGSSQVHFMGTSSSLMDTWLLIDRERPGSSLETFAIKNTKKQIHLHFLKILKYYNGKRILHTASITRSVSAFLTKVTYQEQTLASLMKYLVMWYVLTHVYFSNPQNGWARLP
jgi:hypothetical protein